MRHWPPTSITTDQLGSYPKAIRRLRREGKLSEEAKHRTCKYLNNIFEADHGALKRVIRPTRGFQTMRTAAATIKGFEGMRMIRRGHRLTCKPQTSRTRSVSSTSSSTSSPSQPDEKEQPNELRPEKLMQQSRP